VHLKRARRKIVDESVEVIAALGSSESLVYAALESAPDSFADQPPNRARRAGAETRVRHPRYLAGRVLDYECGKGDDQPRRQRMNVVVERTTNLKPALVQPVHFYIYFSCECGHASDRKTPAVSVGRLSRC